VSTDATAEPIAQLAPRLRDGSLSAIALTEAYLDRLRRIEPRLQSFACVADDALVQARAAAAEISAGRWRGPLHGIPIGIKDNYLTRDMPTIAGTSAPGIAFPLRDSAAVARLRGAGAVILGKTHMHEFAWGNVTPPTRNPWDLERVPGGSSGGSGAAVAARLCAAALGSDTGGSIRIPASLDGTVGLKPTFGRVSRDGVVPHSWSLDHAGPLTQCVGDAALLLNVLAGHDPRDPGSADRPVPDYTAVLGRPLAGLRLGVCRAHFFERNEADVEAAVERAISDLARAGAQIVEIALPLLRYGLGAIFAIELASSTAYHDRSLQAGRTAHYQPDVRTLVEIGRLVTAPDYLLAEQYRRLLIDEFRRAFAGIDLLVAPTTPLTAWRIGEWEVAIGGEDESVLAASWRLTYPFNLTGMPAISLPCGFDRRGLPIGLQIAGRPFDEVTVLAAAAAYERLHDWHLRVPEL
jgi:aspartyl-tRNA(Asn)/glutamyl-tRNA(Gln) amidotransferase subunit A